MIRVRQEQLDEFAGAAAILLQARLSDHLVRHHAGVEVRCDGMTTSVGRLERQRLEDLVRHGTARAKRSGVAEEDTIAIFVALMFLVAPNFAEEPTIDAALTGGDGSADDRLARIADLVPEEAWQNAVRNYAPAAWRV